MTQEFAQIAQLLKGRNPQEIVMSAMRNNNITDPTIVQMIEYAQSGNTNQVFNLAQDFFSKRGMNLNNEFASFMSLLK